MVAQCSCFYSKIVMGEMAVIVLTGRRVSSDKIEQVVFNLNLKLEVALRDCLKK
jgi:NAD dependent epimerase/dehydratase family enzyme